MRGRGEMGRHEIAQTVGPLYLLVRYQEIVVWNCLVLNFGSLGPLLRPIESGRLASTPSNRRSSNETKSHSHRADFSRSAQCFYRRSQSTNQKQGPRQSEVFSR